MKDFQRHRKVVVYAHQAGAAAFLGALFAEDQKRYRGTVYVPVQGASFFRDVPMECVVVGDEKPAASEILAIKQPDAVFLGASVGHSLEKSLMVEAKKRHIPVFSFVDHYWNLWQRFAHERTASRWHYLPDRIYVINDKVKERIIALGCPARLVAVHSHPVLKAIRRLPVKFSLREIQRHLGLPEDSKIALFISEWEYRPSAKWKYDQPKREDVVYLLMCLLNSARRLQRRSRVAPIVAIKTHPAERTTWDRYLRSFDPSIYRIVDQIDKPSLLDASAAVFGLNSMMLLEGLARGRKVYSLHKSKTGQDAWLSTWNPSICELQSSSDCERVLQALVSTGGA